MNFGKAYKIFHDIDNEEYTDNERGEAIYEVMKLATYNSVKKDAMVKVIKYLFFLAFDVEKIEQEAE